MSWLTSLFSSSRNATNARKAMYSAQDAFALPTSSSPLSAHPDAFNGDALESATTPTSYSYPPRGSSYDYVPAGSRSRQSTLLPLHNNSSTPYSSAPYPPLEHTWERLRSWLGREYPELGDTLNWGILPEELAQIEMQFGVSLPQVVKESYLVTDGQEPESSAGCSEGLFFGLTLLPLEDVLEEWRFWREVDDDPATGANVKLRELMESIPPGWVRREYSLRGWIPLVSDRTGNYLGVDMNPAENGTPGQVIIFGRDFDTKVVLWKGDGNYGWAKWLASFVDDLESGEGFEVGAAEESEGSEDDLGYEGYFYDGNGRGSGDGGGDTGTGGMRLIGEYKGWSPLEALADRSLRKWREEGGIDIQIPAEKEKKQSMSLATFDLSTAGHGSGAEVPIPVLIETSEDGTQQPVRHSPEHPPGDPAVASSNSQPIPTISITKPPAPMPVDLPTASDIIPPDSYSQSEEDLEMGEGMMMTEIDPTTDSVSTPVPAPAPALHNAEYSEDAVLVAINAETATSKTPETLSPGNPQAEVDLLSDEEVILEMTPGTTLEPENKQAAGEDEKQSDNASEEGAVSDNAASPVADTGSQETTSEAEDIGAEAESDGDLVDVQSLSSVATTDSKKSGKDETKQKKGSEDSKESGSNIDSNSAA